ncbi:LPS export ABC transporter periplasmic protein LptC [Caulobacter sp. SLTY]|uniref:LPS export ABC transporter periplasmic protein LptC n=1 Tax=Caulobacter sp. SLTY TaxID=2683262 RepID=UPI0014126AE2|nr:LPS export ABC transporter periplasmic protein LptC [Caulobacter sp. SLTY]NBB13834.1 LPS export ABC transporter periplasmic protein LptC [Caulobacter sp. SLTY]
MTDLAAQPDRMNAWRRRSGLIRVLRWLLPALMGALVLALAGYFTFSSIQAGKAQPRETQTEIKLVGARFMGRMEDGRSFLIGAGQAMRSDTIMQEVVLVDPVLTLGGETGAPSRMTAKRGIYDEKTRILRLSGDVRIDDGDGQRVATNDAIVDTRSGKISGQEGLAGDGPLGQVSAKSYEVDRDTGKVTMKGRVRARIEK